MEIQFTNEEDYKKVKNFANYCSDRTMVVELTDSAIAKCNITYPGLLKYEIKENFVPKKATAIVDKGKLKIANAENSLLLFLDIYSGMNTAVKMSSLDRFFIAVEQGIIELSEEAKEIFYPLKFSSTIDELWSKDIRIKFRGNFWKASNYGNDSNIWKTFVFKEATRMKTTFKKITGVITEYSESKNTVIIKSKNANYTLQLYTKTPILKQTLIEGREITIAASKITGDSEKGYNINNPLIIPKELKLDTMITLKAPYSMPTSYYNAIWREFMYRVKGECI